MEVKKLADLCMLNFTDSEFNEISKEMAKIIDFASEICDIPDSQFAEKHAVNYEGFRDDEVSGSVEKTKILDLSPENNEEYIIVPKAF